MSTLSNKKINIYFITIAITLGGLLFGYDTGVINGTQFYFYDPVTKEDISQEFAYFSEFYNR